MHIYYSNDFNLYKIWVMQELQEQTDCVSWGVSVCCKSNYIKEYMIMLLNKNNSSFGFREYFMHMLRSM
jgi:hypothetical protein